MVRNSVKLAQKFFVPVEFDQNTDEFISAYVKVDVMLSRRAMAEGCYYVVSSATTEGRNYPAYDWEGNQIGEFQMYTVGITAV
jgi:hypothetical protein